MKKSDLVKLKNDNYKSHNLTKDMHGIVIETNCDNADVLFFNPHNVGDYAIVNIKNKDLEPDKEKLPTELEKELSSASNALKSGAKNVLAPIAINEYDMVELLVEEERYAKFGAHKGDVGCVMDNNAVQNYIEVDFSEMPAKNNTNPAKTPIFSRFLPNSPSPVRQVRTKSPSTQIIKNSGVLVACKSCGAFLG